MKRKFTTNLILLLALNFLVKPFWIFGIDRSVQNLVGAGEYGIYFALFNFSILFNIVLDFGLTNFNNREISRHANLLSRYLSRMVSIKFLMGLLYAVVSVVFGLIVGYNRPQFELLGILVFNQFLASFILYLRSNISGLQRFKTDSLLSVTDRVVMIILCSYLLWGPYRESFTVKWFALSQSIAYIVTAIIALLSVIKHVETFKPRFDKLFTLSILRKSYPFAILTLLMSFYYRIDSVMLERLLPDGNVQSGIYAQGFRLLDAATMFPFLFSTLLLPIFSKMIKGDEDIKPLLGLAFRILFVAVFSLSIACIYYREPIMGVLYEKHSSESAVVLSIQMAAFLFISLVYMFGTLLTANGSLKQLNIISGVGVMLNILLNFLLIPKYTAIGAAVSSLITQFAMGMLQVLLAIKFFRITIDTKNFLRFLTFLVLVVLTAFFTKAYAVNWFLGFMGTLLAAVIFAVVMRVMSLKELVELLKGNE